jgi:hypothetical protein
MSKLQVSFNVSLRYGFGGDLILANWKRLYSMYSMLNVDHFSILILLCQFVFLRYEEKEYCRLWYNSNQRFGCRIKLKSKKELRLLKNVREQVQRIDYKIYCKGVSIFPCRISKNFLKSDEISKLIIHYWL